MDQPISANVCPGTTAVFVYRVDGHASITRQWRRNGTPLENGPTPWGSTIDGATTDTLIISNAQFNDAGVYDCYVTSPYGLCTTATSNPATLDVGTQCCNQSINPKGSFLRVNQDPDAQMPTVYDLAQCGVLERGQFRWTPDTGYFPCGDLNNPQHDYIGVFSATSQVLDSSLLNRVPDAIAPGVSSYQSPPTPIGGLPTDISQDFVLVEGALYSIPAGARYLIVSPKPFNCSPGVGGNEPVEPAPGGTRGGGPIACGTPVITNPPVMGLHTCGDAQYSFSATAANWGPFTYSWQWRRQGTTTWYNITSGTNTDPTDPLHMPLFTASGVATDHLSLTELDATPDVVDRREVRMTALNFCGSTASDPAGWVIDPNCCSPCGADYDNNGGVDGGDLAAFFADFESGEACADVDLNGGVDGGDLAYFFQVFEAGGC